MLIIIFLIFILSSDDSIFVVDLGFNFRFVYFFLLICVLYFMLNAVNRKIVTPRQNIFMVFFLIISFISFVINPIRERSFFYFFQAALFYLYVCFLVDFCAIGNRFNKVFNLYLLSFVCVAFFGLLQFVLGFFNIDMNVNQWWIDGELPRINALSYEPSFFSTYMLSGWGTFVYLKEYQYDVINKRFCNLGYLLTLISILFSSSRIGFIVILAWYFHYLFKFVFKVFCKNRLSKKDLIHILKLAFLLFILSFILFIDKLSFIFTGTGLKNTSSSSVSIRLQTFFQTIEVFVENYIFGVGLGNIPYHISKMNGVTSVDLTNVKDFEGNNVIIEIFAGTGLIGGLLFILFVINLVTKFSFAKKIIKEQAVLNSLIIGFILMFIALQINQNIFRIYFWVTVAMICSYIFLINKLENKRN